MMLNGQLIPAFKYCPNDTDSLNSIYAMEVEGKHVDVHSLDADGIIIIYIL